MTIGEWATTAALPICARPCRRRAAGPQVDRQRHSHNVCFAAVDFPRQIAAIPNFASGRQSLRHFPSDRRIRPDRRRHDDRHDGGGIDLSVGSTFALANVTALALLNVAHWPVAAAVAATIGVGALAGLVNGLLIGVLKLRAFLTTLVMLTLIRSIVEFLLQIYSVRIASSDVESDAWDFIGSGLPCLRRPFSVLVLAAVAIIAQIVLTRLRIGWRIIAVGGSRRAAYNAGIPVRAIVCLTYVVSGFLTSLAGALRGAAFRRRPRHRSRPRTRRRDGRDPWRQQRRRRPRLRRQGADRRDHRLALTNGLVRLGLAERRLPRW